MMARYNGKSILIDCGEGTQIAMKEKGWSPKPIDIILFTHYHADHISGLPGLLLTMGNAERTEPLLMIGPKGLSRVVSSLRVIAPELPFEIQFRELTEAEESICFDGFHIDAFRVNHNVVCYGYSLVVERKGKFMVEKAKELNIPVKCWNRLQHGESVETPEGVYTPDMVMGEKRKGIKVTYCTDTRPTPAICEHGRETDLLILEGMYGEPEKKAKAREYKHMTFYEAAEIGAKANPKVMWLTHYSPSLTRPEEYMKEVKRIFPRTIAAKDGQTIELDFEEQ